MQDLFCTVCQLPPRLFISSGLHRILWAGFASIKILIIWKFNEQNPLNYSSPLMEIIVIINMISIVTACDSLGEEAKCSSQLDTHLWNTSTKNYWLTLHSHKEDRIKLAQHLQRKNTFLKETACHLSLFIACYRLQNE